MAVQDKLFQHHLKCILQSELILEEDMENLIPHYAFNYSKHENLLVKAQFPYCKLLIGGASLTSSILFSTRNPILAICSSLPVLVISVQQVKEVLQNRYYKGNIQKLVVAVRQLSKLNKMILLYLRQRSSSDNEISNLINPYTNGVRELMATTLKNEINLLQTFRNLLKRFFVFVPMIEHDYSYLDSLNLNICSVDDIKSIQDCIRCQEKLNDCAVLVISNVLTCLGLTLCPSLWAKSDISEILDEIIPQMKDISQQCFSNMNDKFNGVKYYMIKRKLGKVPLQKPKLNESTRLKVATLNTMSHTNDILEKSQIILNLLHEIDDENLIGRETLGRCIFDLRSHAYEYYESLDILYKLYEVNVNTTKPQAKLNPEVTTGPETEPIPVEVEAPHNEPSDDEEYELYIGYDDVVPEDVSPMSLYEEQDSKFASLVIQELKQSLKSNSKFAAARLKRGVVDEEPLPEPVRESRRNIRTTKESTEVARTEFPLPSPPVDSPSTLKNNLCPPGVIPPPPPPLLNPIHSEEITEDTPKTNLLEALQRATGNRSVDVFEITLDDSRS